jgi:vancomycin aglycone glucosyltransferase
MRVLLSMYGSRGDVEPMVGLAVQSRALGAEMRVCAPPGEECYAPVATGVMPTGVWR